MERQISKDSNKSKEQQLETNPMQIHTVIKSIMGCLPLNEILNLRHVCLNWNSASRSVVRQQGKIVFSADFRACHFLEYYFHGNYAPLPMKSFKFTAAVLSENWGSSDFRQFLIQYGNQVEYLEFEFFRMPSKVSDILRDWNRWRPFAPFLVELKVTVEHGYLITLTLSSLIFMKTLWLSKCVLNLNDMENVKMSPQKIALRDVTYTQYGLTLQQVLLNDFLDFKNCSEMVFVNSLVDLVVAYDISTDNVSARKIELEGVDVINWQTSHAITQQLILTRCPFDKINQVQVKEFVFIGSTLNLSYLPKTIEKLSISIDMMQDSLLIGYIDSPNLKSLRVNNQIIHEFAGCDSIMNVDLTTGDENHIGPLHPLPKNAFPKKLNRLKVSPTQLIDATVAINVNHLVIQSCTAPCAAARRLLRNITPKVLVISLHHTIISEQTDDIFEFIYQNENFEEIVVLFPRGLKDANLFSREMVNSDRESYLIFRGKKMGRSLTKEQFKSYFDVY